MRNLTGRLGGGGMQRGRFLQPRDEPRRCVRFQARSLAFSDEYSVLGLTPFASKTDVKRAYKRLALKYHPDVIRNDTEREKHKAFTDIKSAYEGGNGEEFINEVASIGRTCHVNVVALLGFCSEGTNRALVYEFMPKGSLENFIFCDHLRNRQRVLDCQKLFQIAVGIARGLEYLHRGCSTRIVHFDIKPHNILLDDDFCPKISDFGLAKLCPQQQSTLSMLDARGTIGYTAPEMFCRNIGGVSHKSDVYSYGMMVLEMIAGRKNIDAEADKTSQIYFPHWEYKHIELKESLALLGFQSEAEEAIGRKMVLVGLWCIQTDPTNRPSMTKVVEMLEGSLGSLEMPPRPYLRSPSRSRPSTT